MNLLHNLIKQILSHQKFAVFGSDSKNFNTEVQHQFDIFAAGIQVVHFFAIFDRFRDQSLQFQHAFFNYWLLYSFNCSLRRKFGNLWPDIVSWFPSHFLVLKLLKQLHSQPICPSNRVFLILFRCVINVGARKGWVVVLYPKAKEFYVSWSEGFFSLFDDSMMDSKHIFKKLFYYFFINYFGALK